MKRAHENDNKLNTLFLKNIPRGKLPYPMKSFIDLSTWKYKVIYENITRYQLKKKLF